MASKRKARFKVGQVVAIRNGTGYGIVTYAGQYAVGHLRLEWLYKVKWHHMREADQFTEKELRPLTAREKGR